MNISESNKIFRKSILRGFFEPQLLNLDFKKSSIKHPSINDDGLMQSDLLHMFFDLDTGSDYPDGDEWFIVDMLFPYDVKLFDNLIGPDFFTTLSVDEGKTFWHHRELIRFKYGKSKKLLDALDFMESKYKELHKLLEPLQKDLT
ncbi:MAG TPA: hypothetical protein QF518_05795 [Nitrosopumilus sp.]|nr:hypothetical protein [Nitrosopumilus sp.]HJM25604.1 hypothetical protein [Nitrosopumilus sp.]HJO32120.1 hypothetical protein [Nitrosopumilus sp.]